MPLSNKERQIVERAKELGKSKNEAMIAVQNFRSEQQGSGSFFEDAKQDINQIREGFGEDVQQRRENVREIGEATASGEQSTAEGVFQNIGQVAGTAFDALGRGVMGIGKAVLPQSAEDAISGSIEPVIEDIAQSETAQQAQEKWETFEQENPRAARNIKAGLQVAEAVSETTGIGPVIRSLRGGTRLAREGLESGAELTARAGRAATESTPVRVAQTGAERAGSLAGRFSRGVRRGVDEAAETAQLPRAERELVRTGIQQRDIVPLRQATPEERDVMSRMVDSADEAIVKGKEVPAGSEPEAIAGEQVMERLRHLDQRDKKLGKQLGEAVEELPQRSVDVSNVRNTFDDVLDRFNVSKTDEGLEFEGSVLDGQGGQSMRNMLEKINQDLSGELTPSQINTVRQRLWRELDMAKKNFQANATDESAISKIRTELGNALDDFAENTTGAEIGSLRTQLARIKSSKSDVADLIGNDFDRFTPEEMINLRAGEVAGRILNRQSAKYKNILNNLEEVARETGFEADTNMERIIEFADILERNVGTTRTRSFRAETGGAPSATQGARRALGGATRLDPGEVVEGAGEVVRSLEQNAPERIRAIRNLLEETSE